jgi:hypothetical protein
MLTSQNSRNIGRAPAQSLSYPRERIFQGALLALLIRERALRPPSRVASLRRRFSVSSIQPLAPSLQDLIANPRLDFDASIRKQSQLKISNREQMAFFRRPWPAATSVSSSFEPPALSLRNPWPPCGGRLIVTLELENPATRTKQKPNLFSNRYKSPFSRCAILRFSPRRTHSRDMIPALTSTL